MSKVKEREKEPTKETGFRGGSKTKKHAFGGQVAVSSIKERVSVAVEEFKPARIRHGSQFVGIRLDQQSFVEEEKETIGQVDRYSRFIDHVLDLQQDEVNLANWSIAKAGNRKRK